MLAPYRVDANAIADLTDGNGQPADQNIAAALAPDWKTIALLDGQVPSSWQIAQALIEGGTDGALIPSAQNRSGTNLVLWRWHDGTSGNGARLTLIDPKHALSPSD